MAAFGFFLVGWGYTNPAAACFDRAGVWNFDDLGWIPPGAVTCHRHDGLTGATVERVTVYPWRDWLTVMFVAASAALFLAALQSRGRRIVKAAGAYVLFVAAVFAWFFESPLVWAALAAVFAAAIGTATVRGEVR